MKKLLLLAIFPLMAWAQSNITPVNTNLKFNGYLDASGATATAPFASIANPSAGCSATPANQWGVDAAGNQYRCKSGAWVLFANLAAQLPAPSDGVSYCFDWAGGVPSWSLGCAGRAGTITVGTATSGAANTQPVITNSGTASDAIFNFVIPQGVSGTTDVGSVTTGTAGTPAVVTNTGTPGAAILNFVIPQGAAGSLSASGGALTASTTVEPTAGNSLSTRRFSLNSADWQNVLASQAKEVLSAFTVSQLATATWNLNSQYAAGTSVGTQGYNNITQPSNAVFRIGGCPAGQFVQLGNTYPNSLYWICQQTAGTTRYSVDFIVYSDWFDFLIKDGTARYRVLIDGKPTSHYYSTATGSSGSPDQFHVQLDGQPHRVRLQMSSASASASWAGLVTPDGVSDLAAPDWSAGPTVVWVGDEIINVTNVETNPVYGATNNGGLTLTQRACDYLGWNCIVTSLTGSSYVATPAFASRVSGDVCSANPALVVTSGGYYDANSGNLASLQASALSYFNAVNGCSTNPFQLVIGPWEPKDPNLSGGNANLITVDTTVQAAIAQAVTAGDKIQMVASPVQEIWITGNQTNCSTAISTTGNACYLTGANTINLTQEGHNVLGAKVAARIAQFWPQFSQSFDFTSTLQPGPSTAVNVRHQGQLLTGTVSTTPSSATVTGSGTKFTKELVPGSIMQVGTFAGGSQPVTVGSVQSDTSLTLASVWPSFYTTFTNSTYQLAIAPLPTNGGFQPNGVQLATKSTQLADYCPSSVFANGQVATWNASSSCFNPAASATSAGGSANSVQINQSGALGGITNATSTPQFLSQTSGGAPAFTNLSPDPTASTGLDNRRYALNSADWQNVLSSITKEPLNPIAVTNVPASWNLNSTFTAGTSTASQGYGAITPPTNTLFRITGCVSPQYAALGATYPNNLYYACTRAYEAGQYNAEFLVYSDWFDFVMKDTASGNSGSRYRLVIDGKPTSHYFPTGIGTGTGGSLQFHVQLDGKAHRVKLQLNGPWGGIISPNGSADLAAPDTTVGPSVVIVGDSFTEPTIVATTNPIIGTTQVGGIGWAFRACDYMGWNCFVSGLGGTGYVNPGSGGRVPFGSRVSADVCADSPAMVVTAGGINDASYLSTLQAAALAYFNAVAACPSNPVQLVLGPFSPVDPTQGGNLNIPLADTAIQAAVVQAKTAGDNIFYAASPVNELWTSGALTNCGTLFNTTGNACWVTNTTDTTHPTQEGHNLIGAKAAARFAQMFPQSMNLFDYTSPIQQGTVTIGLATHPTQAKTGTVTATNGSASVTGSGTKFTTELQPGWPIYIGTFAGGNTPVTVLSIQSDTAMTLSATWSPSTATAVAYQLASYPYPTIFGVQPNGVQTGLGYVLYNAATNALPSCTSALKGQKRDVSDATSPTFLGTYTSGGAVYSPVACNGTNWVTY